MKRHDSENSRKGIAGKTTTLTFNRFISGLPALLLISCCAIRAQAQFPANSPPPKPYVVSAPAVQKLANGLTIMTIERHDLPLVTLRCVVKAGAEADPPNAPGTAQLVSALLNQGTATRSARQIAEVIDRAGGTIDTGADWDGSYVELSILSDQTEQAFDLLADMIRRPAFEIAEVERKRKQTLSALAVAYQDPGYVADTAFDRLALAGTAYGHPQDGTQESVARLTPADLRAFHARFYRPENSILAAVGDITPEQTLTLAGKFFGDWKPAADPAEKYEPTSTETLTPDVRIIAIEKPDAVQTEIRVGSSGVPRDSKDYVALTVANQVLGGPAANRLFSSLRTRRGLTYGASSDLECFRTAGSWEAKTFTRTSETMTTLKVILNELKDIHDHDITGAELQTTKSYLVGHLALQFESSDSVAEHMLDLMVNGLPLDYWNRFPEEVNALTVDDVRAAVRRILDPEHPIIVLVGNVGEFQKDLRKLGAARMIPLSSLDFGSVNLERGKGSTDGP